MVIEKLPKSIRLLNIMLDGIPRLGSFPAPKCDSRSYGRNWRRCPASRRGRNCWHKGCPSTRPGRPFVLAQRFTSLKDLAAEFVGWLTADSYSWSLMERSLACPSRISYDYGPLEWVSFAMTANFVTQQTRRRSIQQFRDYAISDNNHDRFSCYNVGDFKLAIEDSQIGIIAWIITMASKMITNQSPAAYWTQGCRK